MDKKFMVYAKHADLENNISIECSDIADMDKHAEACKDFGYIDVVTKAKPFMETFYKASDKPYEMPMCPRCKEPSYSKEFCPFCGQWIEWEEI